MLRLTKNRQVLVAIAACLYIVGSVLASLFVQTVPVSAAPSVCYFTSSTNVAHAEVAPCTTFEPLAQLFLGHPFRSEDHCYSMHRSLPGLNEAPLSSQQCASLAASASSTATAEKKCWTLNGPMSGYDDLSFFYSTIKDSDHLCSQAEMDIIRSKYGSGPEPGYCYVFSTEDTTEVRRATCAHLFAIILASNSYAETDATLTPPNATREEIDTACRVPAGQQITEDLAEKCLKANPLMQWIAWIVNMLSAGAGVIIVLMIVIGGIQYSTAGANPQAVSAAKSKIINAILALLALIFLYAFLQWLVPGGIF